MAGLDERRRAQKLLDRLKFEEAGFSTSLEPIQSRPRYDMATVSDDGEGGMLRNRDLLATNWRYKFVREMLSLQPDQITRRFQAHHEDFICLADRRCITSIGSTSESFGSSTEDPGCVDQCRLLLLRTSRQTTYLPLLNG